LAVTPVLCSPGKKNAKKTAPNAKPKTAHKAKSKATPKAKHKTAPITKINAAAKKGAPKEQKCYSIGKNANNQVYICTSVKAKPGKKHYTIIENRNVPTLL
jgi:hypothetical protein